MHHHPYAMLPEELVTLCVNDLAVLAMERRAVYLQDAPRALPAHQNVGLPVLPGALGAEPGQRVWKEERARPIKRLRQVQLALRAKAHASPHPRRQLAYGLVQ